MGVGHRLTAAIAACALLAGCGGDGGGASTSGAGATAGPAPTPTPTATSACSLLNRQQWAEAQLREWYLFPDTLPTSLSPAGFTTVDDYIDALTATARAQRKDRYFTYLTSIAEENAYYQQGSSAGFGFRLGYDTAARRVVVIEAFEGTAALSAGIDRGTEIVAIGTSAATLQTVDSLIAAGGPQAVSNALGESSASMTRVLRIADASGVKDVTLTKTDYTLTPVSSRYGAKIIERNGKKYGYVNLRTFIDTAEPALRSAFANFRAQGVTDVVVDFRYNGGGLVSIAELMGDLLGGGRSTSDVFSYTTFRPEKSSNNDTRQFAPQPQSIAPMRVAFIGTGGTASASELVINAFIPYLRSNAGLIGGNTFGKPVGQIALDRAACDDRLRVVAFATQNAARQGDYYDGLATKVEASCQANDDITRQMGDPEEASTRAAIDFLAGVPCTRISGVAANARAASTSATRAASANARELLTPARPTTPQREAPGSF
ncbi:S41 family peptidase [Sphingomonas sp. SUN019]|uniref:S41 family peptidase n=1 Tax=Sphingomonas sp. SUN019 TaxID=2937788 RepID=UPI00216451BA|nr:S41 family peptidase [Sphingomonas sp. SUN019]UVO51338.1 S41 family peptidase [Sphingomonas sp. SUN019]